jgi:SAM-dependent methyltransferase
LSLPDWLESLRRREIVGVVRSSPDTQGDHLLGIHKDEVINQVIDWGQADFDAPYLHLSGADRALLYAYFNQPRHLEELYEAFTQLFKGGPPADPLIVLDVGCGPFTGGLALAAVLGNGVPFTYIGLDQSSAMRELGERLASAAERVGALNCMERQWAKDLNSVVWQSSPGWRPILVIASYLLASRTLNAERLVADVDALCARIGRGRVTVLYTNSQHAGPNRSFGAFRAALENAGFSIFADDIGSVTIERLGEERRLRYALFHRDARRILDV